MEQTKIWDYFQTTGVESFSQSGARFRYIANRISPRARVLNIGVGNGELERLIIERGAEVWSLDPSEGAIQRLREQCPIGERARVGRGEAIPFEAQTFDTVVMTEVLEHLDGAVLSATVSEVCRVLREGGVFIGTVPADEILADNVAVCPDCGKVFHRWGHVQSFSKRSIRTELERRFVTVRIDRKHFGDFRSLNWKGRIIWVIKGLLVAVGMRGRNESFYFSASRDVLRSI